MGLFERIYHMVKVAIIEEHCGCSVFSFRHWPLYEWPMQDGWGRSEIIPYKNLI